MRLLVTCVACRCVGHDVSCSHIVWKMHACAQSFMPVIVNRLLCSEVHTRANASVLSRHAIECHMSYMIRYMSALKLLSSIRFP